MQKIEWFCLKRGWLNRDCFEEDVKWAKSFNWQKEDIWNRDEDDHELCEICCEPIWKNEMKYTDGHGDYLCEFCYLNFIKYKKPNPFGIQKGDKGEHPVLMDKVTYLWINKGWIYKWEFEKSLKWAQDKKWKPETDPNPDDCYDVHCEICTIPLSLHEKKYIYADKYLCEYCFENFAQK